MRRRRSWCSVFAEWRSTFQSSNIFLRIPLTSLSQASHVQRFYWYLHTRSGTSSRRLLDPLTLQGTSRLLQFLTNETPGINLYEHGQSMITPSKPCLDNQCAKLQAWSSMPPPYIDIRVDPQLLWSHWILIQVHHGSNLYETIPQSDLGPTKST
jgi:hypothetical protein